MAPHAFVEDYGKRLADEPEAQRDPNPAPVT
jgi:hypothetical protein